jgi:hypothetical protein
MYNAKMLIFKTHCLGIIAPNIINLRVGCKQFEQLQTMKKILLIILFFSTQLSFGQDINKIESKLSKAFFKIQYWKFYDNGKNVESYDSLEKANDQFEKLLLNLTSKNPQTINYKFKSLIDSGLTISTSADGNFRIYNWDTWTGGTMHIYNNVFQYKANGKVFSKTLNNAKNNDGDPDCLYYEINQVTSNNKNFYLAFSSARLSSGLSYQNIKVFSIDSNKLDDNAKLIKTRTGIKNQLGYEVDLTSSANRDRKVPNFHIEYDKINKVISIPVILDNNEVTNKKIKYKFNGTYFEKL